MTSTTVKMKVSFRTCQRQGVQAKARPKVIGPTAITRRLALAHHVEALIANGELAGLADAAKRLGLTRARMTQIADMTLLAPQIQAAIALGEVSPIDRQLRDVLKHATWDEQLRVFERETG
tara:strand:- start:157 stop:519 length:363 start_codon:yes stop_codon:yes gene_type:complete